MNSRTTLPSIWARTSSGSAGGFATTRDHQFDQSFNGRFRSLRSRLSAHAAGVNTGLTAAADSGRWRAGRHRFRSTAGIPPPSINYADLGLYGEDDWRARPNMTLSMGLRFETQTGIHDHADIAPRVGLAWGLGRGKSPKIRAARRRWRLLRPHLTGLFIYGPAHERLQSAELYLVGNPDFFPNLPNRHSGFGRGGRQAVRWGSISGKYCSAYLTHPGQPGGKHGQRPALGFAHQRNSVPSSITVRSAP